jgi:hypothetical protein
LPSPYYHPLMIPAVFLFTLSTVNRRTRNHWGIRRLRFRFRGGRRNWIHEDEDASQSKEATNANAHL